MHRGRKMGILFIYEALKACAYSTTLIGIGMHRIIPSVASSAKVSGLCTMHVYEYIFARDT